MVIRHTSEDTSNLQVPLLLIQTRVNPNPRQHSTRCAVRCYRPQPKQPSAPVRTISMPDDVEVELYNHIVWMCDNGYPVSWDGIKEVAWQLGRICHLSGELH